MLRFLVPLLIFFMAAGASGAGAVSISPPNFEFIIEPGAAATGQLTIRNTEKEPRTFVLGVVGAEQNERGFPGFARGLDIAESWVALEQKTLTLNPGAVSQVSFSVTVPEGTAPTAHYLGITVDTEKSLGGAMGIAGRVIALLQVQVAGTVTEGLRIKSLGTKSAPLWQRARAVNLTVVNEGTIPVAVRGDIQLDGPFMNTATQTLALGGSVLARAERTRSADVLIPGVWPGFYTANVLVEYGRTGQIARDSVTFLFVPQWFLVGVGVIAGSGAVWRLVPHRKKYV